MKKSLLFYLFTLISISGFAQSGVWVPQSSAFTRVSSGVRQMSVIDSMTAWICAYEGASATIGLPRQDYSRTIDGGAHWITGTVQISTPNPTSWDWSSIYGLTDSIAWAGFFNGGLASPHQGQIYRTLDAGTTWVRQGANTYQSPTESFLNNIYFWNAAEGVATGDPITMASGLTFEIYITSDSGNTWALCDTNNLSAAWADEANQITHYTVVGDTMWWDSNHGRVFRSVDRGHNWTVSNTNLINFNGIIDICFYNHQGGGIARYYNDTIPDNVCVETSDGGLTWSAPFIPSGDMFGGDIKAVPGTDSMLVSTGISGNFTLYWGTSYSLDGGHTWTTIESARRGVLGIADSLHMWCGYFTSSPVSEGIFCWKNIQVVPCSDPNISSGVTNNSDTALCVNDTAVFTTTGIYAPVEGSYYGWGFIITTADISGSADPLNEPSLTGSMRFHMPADTFDVTSQINDGSFFGSTVPWGTYYFTPVSFGNATAGTIPPQWMHDLILDPNCLVAGTSVHVNFQYWLNCSPVGMDDIYSKYLTVNSFMQDKNVLNVNIGSAKPGLAKIQIVDITGRTIRSMEFQVKEGSNHELVNIDNLAQGTYMVNAEMNGVKATSKIFKY
jgi:photosystem II stability/assembly factor-like uncharacterized protein